MCTSDTCFGPDPNRWKVTRTDTGEIKKLWALTSEGAIKLANWPPSVCEVVIIFEDTIWVEADQVEP